MDKHFKFEIIAKDKKTKARAGRFSTPHGVIETPTLSPVGTQATVKSLTPRDLKEAEVQLIMANTYHLHLRPGEEVIKKFGGIGKFMGWDGPTITDSGGFQVFSLGVSLEHGVGKLLREDDDGKAKPRLNKITEEGVTFQSHLDGSTRFLSPERSMEIQEKLGADLIIGFDDLESPKYSYEDTKKSLELTNRWLLRSKKAHKRRDQLLYGVTHGGQFEDLRCQSAKFVNDNFEAIALGGAHKNKKNMYDVVEWTVKNTDEGKPRHMLGVGEIDDIFNIVEKGIDTFDCVVPTRLGRTGFVFVSPPEGDTGNRFRIDITKSVFTKDKKPLTRDCNCYVCQNFTRGYLNHLFRARELLAYQLATYHNVFFFTHFLKSIRNSIINNMYGQKKKEWIKGVFP